MSKSIEQESKSNSIPKLKLLLYLLRDYKSQVSWARITNPHQLVGDKIAQSIIDYFADEDSYQLIERLKSYGLQFEHHENTIILGNELEGKQIVVSGVFTVDREEIKKLVVQYGGKIVSGISKNTSFVLAGENMGPSKLAKAKELGIDIISEEEFRKLIEE